MNTRVRHIVAIVALLSTVLSVHGSLVARVLFELRQDHIAEHHCENRFDPESKCNGMCFLKKRMAEAEHHEHEKQVPQLVMPVLLYVASAAIQLVRPSPPAEPVRASDPVWRSDPHQVTIDHPPRMV